MNDHDWQQAYNAGRREASEELMDALTNIAAFNDTTSSERLAKTGSYASFDEPYSVETARTALAKYREG
jgi:hypothetical protein